MKNNQIIQLGRHKLMCGDATKREDVLKLVGSERVNLVLQDPPYGIQSVNYKSRSMGKGAEYAPVLADNSRNISVLCYMGRTKFHGISSAVMRVAVLGQMQK